MNYRDHVFITVADNLSFSKAAEELFISQPAVTKHIKELERSLKVTLFERKGNRIYLTYAGKLTYNYLKKIKEQYNELEFELGRLNNTFKGVLRLGASSTISQYVIPNVIAEFHNKYPEIKFYLYNGNSVEIEKKLLDNNIDMALVENFSSHTNISYIDLLVDKIIAVAGNNSIYAQKGKITISELKGIPLILREKGSGTLEVINKTFDKHNVAIDELNIIMRLGSTESIKNFLMSFDGISLVSERAVEKELQMKIIKKIYVNNMNITRNFRIAVRQGTLSSASKLFKEFLLNYNF